MRVGLDLLYLVPGESGGRETYARELVPAMLECSPELDLVAFVNRDAGRLLAGELGATRSVVVPVSGRGRAGWALGELALVSVAARRAGVDLVHSMANFAPAWGGFRRVVTIHDLQYMVLPELLSWPVRTATSALVSLGAHRADRIIAVSETGRQEVAAGLGVERARIDVVRNGVRPPPPEPATRGVRARYGLEERPFALAVATNLPHKNLPVLFDALRRINPERRPVLVLAGHGTTDRALRGQAEAAGVIQDVRLLGALNAQEIDGLYTLASCLVLPTLHEGFGLPVLEAMARSLPVACSDIPVLREVAGDCAVYFDPRRAQEIAGAIEAVTGDEALAGRLRRLGVERAASFSWARAAAGTVASYRAALATA